MRMRLLILQGTKSQASNANTNINISTFLYTEWTLRNANNNVYHYPGISSARLPQNSAFPAEMYPPATSMIIFNNYPGISSAKLLQNSAFPAEMYPPATSMIIFNNYPGISSAKLLQNSAFPAEMYPPATSMIILTITREFPAPGYHRTPLSLPRCTHRLPVW